MFDIIICEDNEVERSKIEGAIQKALHKNNFEGQIVLSTGEPSKVLDYAGQHHQGVMAYFLDIDLKANVDGLILAKNIRERDRNCYLVFITAHLELSLMTFQYKVRALDYISKSDFETLQHKVEDCLTIINEENKLLTSKTEKYKTVISIKSGSTYFNINVKDIVFIETMKEKNKIKIHMVDSFIEYHGTLRDILKELDPTIFLQCHKSYVANINHIKQVDKIERVILTDNGEKCFVSRNYMKEVLSKCLN